MINTLTNIPTKTVSTKLSDERSNVDNLTSFKVKIPIDTDFKKLHNPFKKNRKRGNDHNAYILGMLAYKSEQKRLSYNTYHSLSRDILMQLFRGNYKNYMSAMIEADYIKEYSNPYEYKANGNVYKSKGTFKPGLTSKKYALKEKKPIFKEYTITDKKLINKINRARIERTERVIKNNPTAKNVYESIKKLSIDGNAVRSFLFNKYERNTIKNYGIALVRKIGKRQTRKFIQEIQATTSEQRLIPIFNKYGVPTKYCKEVRKALDHYNKLNHRIHQVNVIEQIESGNYSFISMSEDKKTGRLFHTLTMTPKDIKPFLKLDNEKLIELDASNCQWWLIQKVLHILISNDFYSNNSKKEKQNISYINNNRYIDIHKYINTQSPYFYMCYTFLQKHKENIRKEVFKLESVLDNGTFRELFKKEFKRQGKDVTDNQIKMWLLKHILFSDPKQPYHKNLTIVKEFYKLFPYISKMIKDLKTDLLNNKAFGYADENRWKCLSLLLQRMEADVFIKDMANCNAVYMTLHDALVTNDSNLHKVYKSITNSVKTRNLKMKFN